jgi:hypothetical protein
MRNASQLRAASFVVFGFSVAAGSFVWLASRSLTGHREPWDGGSFYAWYLLAVGLIAGAAVPRRLWLCALGVWLGQAFGFLCLPGKFGSLAPIGFLFVLPASSLISLVGSLIGALVGKVARRLLLPHAEQPLAADYRVSD